MSTKTETQTELFYDTLFRVRKKNGTWVAVEPPLLNGALFADAHTHVQFLPNPPLALARAAAHGVGVLCNVFDVAEDDESLLQSMPAWEQQARDMLVRFGESNPHMKPRSHSVRLVAACGCHPHNAKVFTAQTEERLCAWLAQENVRALGEIGLDYHYDFSPKAEQIAVFRTQLALANELNIPAVLHVREAHEDAWKIVQEQGIPQAGMLLHCVTTNWETLKPWVEAGCMVSFGGALTFGNSDAIRFAMAQVPLEQLLLETDAPYMAPKPFRGLKCEPAQMIFSAAELLRVRGIEDAAEQQACLAQLCTNMCSFFGITDVADAETR